MTSLLDERPGALAAEGVQRPRILWVPPTAVSTAAGEEACELAAMAGLYLDPWEEFDLKQAMAEDDRGKWAAFEVGLVVPRQNGKGSILEARELAGLFLLGEQLIIHSAHEFDTAREHFLRILELIESTPAFDRRVQRVDRSHGAEGIGLKGGQRLRFKARTKSGGRGLSGDVVVLDEAMIMSTQAVGALMPTMAAKSQHGNPQVWYTASSGLADSYVLGAIRARGLRGGDPSLCYMEHSIDEQDYLVDPIAVATDPVQIARANPGLGIRISLEHVLREQRSMDSIEYARERLGVGEWPPDPDDPGVIKKAQWKNCADTSDKPPVMPPASFAVDASPDRSRATVSVAAQRPDGLPQVQILKSQLGVEWAAQFVIDLVGRHTTCAVVIDPRSAANSLITDLEAAGIEVKRTSTQDLTQACGQFYDAATEGRMRHLDQPELNAAVAGATKRNLGDAFAWDRRLFTTDITPLVSATLALWGWTTRDPEPPKYASIFSV